MLKALVHVHCHLYVQKYCNEPIVRWSQYKAEIKYYNTLRLKNITINVQNTVLLVYLIRYKAV